MPSVTSIELISEDMLKGSVTANAAVGNKIKRRTHFVLQQAHSNLRGPVAISISPERSVMCARFAVARRDAAPAHRSAAADGVIAPARHICLLL